MPVTLEDVLALKKRSEENKTAQIEDRSYLALELIADALILTLEQELDEEMVDEDEEDMEEDEEADDEDAGSE